MSSELSHENPVAEVLKPLTEFVTQSQQLVNKCTKPDQKGASSTLMAAPVSSPSRAHLVCFIIRNCIFPLPALHDIAVSDARFQFVVYSVHIVVTEFKKIGLATLIGFLTMGLIGFFIKLIFIPINQIFLA
jgi:preprotein translocase subunit Sss1